MAICMECSWCEGITSHCYQLCKGHEDQMTGQCPNDRLCDDFGLNYQLPRKTKDRNCLT